MSLPLPPLELCRGGHPLAYDEAVPANGAMAAYLRETSWFDPSDPLRSYEQAGAELRRAFTSLLPADWSFEGRRALDFGCGAGRVLRHFAPESRSAEIWGADIDGASIEWLQANLCPPFHAVRNDPHPPLPFPDGNFDLIWAYSVFTHLPMTWSEWLVELHRVLKPGGLLLATVVSGEMATLYLGRPFEEDRVSMLVRAPSASWEVGGPLVVHSEWWLRAHWGRAFEVLELKPIGTSDPSAIRHTVAVLRKRTISLTPAELEVPEPEEPREVAAQRQQILDHRLAAQAHQQRHQAAVASLEAELARLNAERERLGASLGAEHPDPEP